AMAEHMGMGADSIHALALAGQVHDLGKLRIPAEILTKPGQLSDIEYRLMQEHPQASHDLLKGIDFAWPVAEIAYQHHERLDGSGYPRGLKGEEMLPEARVLAVADVFEAMSSHRPYRAALGVEAALAELEARRGSLYDPAAVDACAHLIREEHFSFD
ncbi:MAG: HD domain-containing protein, partial [Dehalococcoidia bacterium]|nr:HD domain-containing protein [Dehalococcoidia bacterium]